MSAFLFFALQFRAEGAPMKSEVFHVLVRHAITGGLIGICGFILFNGFYLKRNFEALAAQKAISLDLLRAETIGSPYYWAVFVLMVALGALIGYVLPIRVTPIGLPL
jgi:hypothetical protein